MKLKTYSGYKKEFGTALFDNMIPFWEKLSPDKEYGGYLSGFDRQGNLFYTDKSVWNQGRILWMFSKLYNEVEKKQIWLDSAKLGYDFINKYCFDENVHMYFRVTREGKPLIIRRYYFSEAFTIMGYAEYYKAAGLTEAKERAIELYKLMMKYFTTPYYFPPKVNPNTRKTKGHSIFMIMLNVSQIMREIDNDPIYDETIDYCLDIILNQFVKWDEQALLETIGYDGERIDSPEGRLINPGHMLETSWFIMEEAIHRKDKELMEKAIKLVKWALERGWDDKYGGILYFVDLENKPLLSLEWDMKLLWTHCEALYALLLSYHYTKNEEYIQMFDKVYEYVFAHFQDTEYPEWYGHLHRDGTPISQIKGSDWKSPYHNVRAFMLIHKELGRLENGEKLF